MAQPKFQPGDKVQQLARSCLVLTVVSHEGEWVRCETRHIEPAFTYFSGETRPEREVVTPWRIHWSQLTHYDPHWVPTPAATLEFDVVGMTAVDLLEYSRDGHITNAEYDAARAEDDRRLAARLQAAE